jgi:mono/diheme cytochrome c family protein
MQLRFQRTIVASVLCLLALPTISKAQSGAANIYKTNCTLCHGTDGSGNTPSGKAMHAKDLRTDEVQKQSDAALAEVITKGKGKMPVFGAKLKSDDIAQLVVFIRQLPRQK